MIVVAITSIAAAMVLPMMSGNDRSIAESAAYIMIGDLDFAQATAINDPSEMILIRFDPDTSRWWVAAESSPEIPLTKMYSNDPMDTTMGVGRADSALDVTFQLSGVTENRIAYNAFGQLAQTETAVITVKIRRAVTTITIDPETGFLEINSE